MTAVWKGVVQVRIRINLGAESPELADGVAMHCERKGELCFLYIVSFESTGSGHD